LLLLLFPRLLGSGLLRQRDPGCGLRAAGHIPMAGAAAEAARHREMLASLQRQDRAIDHVVLHSKFVVAYLLQHDGPTPGWRKANVEGPMYLVRRRAVPRYRLLVKNQLQSGGQPGTGDLLDDVHPDWELDCQANYIFYKVEDPAKKIRGLWVHDDTERQKIEAAIEKTLQEIRNKPPEPTAEAPPQVYAQQGGGVLPPQQTHASHARYGHAQPGAGGAGGGAAPPAGSARAAAPVAADGSAAVAVTRDSARRALHACADDEGFLGAVFAKLRESSRRAGAGGTEG